MHFIDLFSSNRIDWWSPIVVPVESNQWWKWKEFFNHHEDGITEGLSESHHVMVF